MKYNKEKVERLKEEYPAGTEIELIEMIGEPQMKPGLEGKVIGIDDACQLLVDWESGSNINLHEEDKFKRTFYIVIEKEGREENGYIAEYKVLKSKPEDIQEGWRLEKLQVEVLDEANYFHILDRGDSKIFYGGIEVNLSKKDLEKISDLVITIDTHNFDMICNIASQVADAKIYEAKTGSTVYY